MNTAEKMREHFRKYPNANITAVAEKFDSHTTAVYKARMQAKKEIEPKDREPRARKPGPKPGPKSGLLGDVTVIKKIGIDRVRKILELIS